MNLFPAFAISDPIADMMDGFFNFEITAPVLSSLLVMAIVALLAIIVGIEARVQDPLKAPHGLLLAATFFIEWIQKWAKGIMGVEPGDWPGYFLCLFVYLFLSFIWSITGLSSFVDYLVCPLCLSVVMFVLIQATGLRYSGWRYFHRYIEPLKVWLPINLITMWTPIISTSLRMFGNCLAGSVILTLLSWALKKVSLMLFSFLPAQAGQTVLGPIIIAVLNLYFALFSGYIQTLVFASLNAVWIGQEIPDSSPMGATGQVVRPEAK